MTRSKTIKPVLPHQRLLRVTQVADMCGVQPSTIYRWIRQGNFPPAISIGGARRWKRSEIEKFIADLPEVV